MRKLFVFLMALMFCHAAYAAELFGTVDALSGSAYVSDNSGKSTPVIVGQKIYEEQTINSGPDGEVHLVTEDGGIVAIRPDTVFRVDQYKAESSSADKIFMSLFKGAIRSVTGWVGKHNSSAYLIITPNATIGIRGTDHETAVIDKGDGDEPGTYDTVNEGATVLKTLQGEAEVIPGKFAFAPSGRAVAPIFLAQRPRFLALRKLKIEQRIQQRKEFFRSHMEQMREKRIKRLQEIHAGRAKQARGHQGGLRQQERMAERRKEIRGNRMEQQAGQKLGAGRMEAMRRREEKEGGMHAPRQQHREMMQRGGGNKAEEHANQNRQQERRREKKVDR
ncbi:MAG: FecR domain-containing protein [Nitrosomonadales bacterium]|nr:FecR domain-containing protein [Nitrosomonadales bacterium]